MYLYKSKYVVCQNSVSHRKLMHLRIRIEIKPRDKESSTSVISQKKIFLF